MSVTNVRTSEEFLQKSLLDSPPPNTPFSEPLTQHIIDYGKLLRTVACNEHHPDSHFSRLSNHFTFEMTLLIPCFFERSTPSSQPDSLPLSSLKNKGVTLLENLKAESCPEEQNALRLFKTLPEFVQTVNTLIQIEEKRALTPTENIPAP